ncbi:MAG TPA: DUF5916 domain-containing protein [Cyclobacteriaceae bacterium]|jgi:hypothetical protein|nr:DUF5916 domain-containing protein [Cyclobacteriaceae bacterium]
MTDRLRVLLIVSWLFGASEGLEAQNKPGKELGIKKASSIIKLDGLLDDPDWLTAETAKDFFQNYPVDSLPPTFQSEVKLTFDDHFLYVGIVCYDDEKPDVMQSLRRDFDWGLNDNFGVYFDPFNDFTNGFYFIVTPFGVQQEGLMSSGGSGDDSFNANWDNKWYSKVIRYKDKWVGELAIPFKSIRFNKADWNITFLRNDLKRNQVSSWIATPIQYIPASFAYSGKLKWKEPPPHHTSNISVIPYMAGSVSQDKENHEGVKSMNNIGMDAKIGLTPSLNLDLTFNPDFSNVEVDRQVINLTRFEFGFPERRQFFLENSDLFSKPGFPDSRAFFSRRIGLARDTADKIRKVPILYGARVSGKIGKNWRIGAMNLMTDEKKSLGLPMQNYSVAVVQRQVFSRSTLGFSVVNKQSLKLGEYDSTKFYHKSVLHEKIMADNDTLYELNKSNTVIGADFNLNTKSNRWVGKLYYHRSFNTYKENKNYSGGVFVAYNTRRLGVYFAEQALGKNFHADVGFVPGLDVYPGLLASFGRVEWKLYPKKGKVNLMGPGFEVNYTNTPDGTITDKIYSLDYFINFSNTSRIYFRANNTFQKLTEDFNPIDPKGDSTLLAGMPFSWDNFSINYSSDQRKVFNYKLGSSLGGFYNGNLYNANGELNYRYQPFGSISVKFDYNAILLPEGYGSARFLLISPRLDLTFTDKLFLTTFVQYNDRDDNTNLNARFQWRFKPASDFFVVYTENYFPEQLVSKNRALVLKLTYWLNL